MYIKYILTETGLVLISPVFSFDLKMVYPDFGNKNSPVFWIVNSPI